MKSIWCWDQKERKQRVGWATFQIERLSYVIWHAGNAGTTARRFILWWSSWEQLEIILGCFMLHFCFLSSGMEMFSWIYWMFCSHISAKVVCGCNTASKNIKGWLILASKTAANVSVWPTFQKPARAAVLMLLRSPELKICLLDSWSAWSSSFSHFMSPQLLENPSAVWPWWCTNIKVIHKEHGSISGRVPPCAARSNSLIIMLRNEPFLVFCHHIKGI